jgi:hypothetical protein
MEQKSLNADAEINADDSATASHIIVTGYSRSGTTMFYHMLRSTVSNFEFVDEEVPAERMVGMDRKNRITKRPLDLFSLEAVQENNIYGKKLSLVILIRDIRSILTSYHEAVPDDYFIGYDHQYFFNRSTGEYSYTNPGILHIHQAIAGAMNSQAFSNRIILKYEDLLSDLCGQQERLGNLLGLDYTGSFEHFHRKEASVNLSRQLNTLRAPDRSRIESWKSREHERRIRSQFTRCPLLFDILINYGYEKDRRWFDQYRRKPGPAKPV